MFAEAPSRLVLPTEMFHFLLDRTSAAEDSAVLTRIDGSPGKSSRFHICWIPCLAAETFGRNISQSKSCFSPTAAVKTHRYGFYMQIKRILKSDLPRSFYLDGILQLHVVRICPVKFL